MFNYFKKRKNEAVIRAGIRRYVSNEYNKADAQVVYYKLLRDAGILK